ncbi:MAG: 3-isopropylmalate dehydratase small subunit [Thermoleophilia bacterium]
MRPFVRHTGRAAVLDRPDVDTDQIVPKQFLKSISRTGFAQALFYDWMKDPAFELRQPEAQGATILLAGPNFGCGSSREHAVWALMDYGFQVVIAPSFGDIFRSNALKNGLLPVTLPAEEVKRLMQAARGGGEITVDLEAQAITAPDGEVVFFQIETSERYRLLNGLDDIGLTLRYEKEIAAFEAEHPAPIDTTSVAA